MNKGVGRKIFKRDDIDKTKQWHQDSLKGATRGTKGAESLARSKFRKKDEKF